MGIIVATDVGGTCTDTVVVEKGKPIVVGKALSTPPNFAEGVMDSVKYAAEAMHISVEQLFEKTTLFLHGATVVDNILYERKGSTTGLITTQGFEDTLGLTRGAYGRWGGLTEAELKHSTATDRATPLVPRDRICGIPERVDYKGEIIRQLDEESVEQAIRYLVTEKDVDAIAVSLLWSFKNPSHEQRIKEIIQHVSPHTYVTISSDIAPVPGEYERTSTTVINAYAGRMVEDYIGNLEELILQYGCRAPLLVMQGYGGLLPSKEAATSAVTMLECGPAAGVIGAKFLGEVMGDSHVIAADMGGTTFKVGIIQNGELEYALEPIVNRFHYCVPKLNVVSIGAGGGSLITLETGTNVPQVGPESAGARPGPICYGLGGTDPTLTDVLLLIGYIDPNLFLNGTMTLDVDSTRRIFKQKIADPMGLSVDEAAIGIFEIASAQVTDLLHKITVEQGLDPRDFVLQAFGGSCPMLATTFGQALNVKKIVVPYTAAVNCAFGMGTSNVVHEYALTETLSVPASADYINQLYQPLMAKARATLESEGFAGNDIELRWSVGFRYSRQVHEVITPVHADTPIDSEGLERLVTDFEQLYENKYGKGSALRDAGIEMTQFRLTASGIFEPPEMILEPINGEDAADALLGQRNIYVNGRSGFNVANIYDFEKLLPGNLIPGPAVIHTPITTIVIQDGQCGAMDGYKNIVIEVD